MTPTMRCSTYIGVVRRFRTLNMKTLWILLIAAAWMPMHADAQKLEKVTGLKLEYWRAFHGVIQQQIVIPPSGKIALNSTIFPGMTKAQQDENKKHSIKTITDKDLDSMMTLFNYADVRQFFASTKPDDRLDGSVLSITLTQNSFSITFTSQDAFTRGSSRFPTALGRAALELFVRAGIAIPKDELY